MSVHSRVCLVCTRQMSKYTCPRCNTPYCSLLCYKNHGKSCTEGFAKDNLTSALKNKRASKEDKMKMVEILKRVHENEDEVCETSDEDIINPVADDSEVGRWLEKMTLGEEDDLDVQKLGSETKKAFHLACMAGKLREHVEQWTPWWIKPIIIPSGQSMDNPSLTTGPQINEDIPNLETLYSGKPSPMLPYHLLDIVFAYTSTLFTYNGDWDWDERGAMSTLIYRSSVLSTPLISRHHSFEAALRACLTLHRSQDGANEEATESLSAAQHCVKVFNGGRLRLLQLLSDLLDLSLRAEACVVQERDGKNLTKAERRKSKREVNSLCKIQHKVTFFLSWVNSLPDTEIHLWTQEVDLVVQTIVAIEEKREKPTIFHIDGDDEKFKEQKPSCKKKIVIL